MRLELRAPPPAGIEIRIEPARPRPLDWDRWRDAALAGTPLEPIAESCTVPEGWPVAIVEIATPGGLRMHAFYAVFDLAVHAWADLPRGASLGMRARLRAAFARAVPAWPDDIVALADL